ncbi:NUDIX domain-containing protein [Geothrix sp. 21YS21S-2]|uniref:NUDIX domain-containing protein n=1 Tax=Geothrix sp. 21YS21S-2 TaxID=3068893 RepID=UPI0027B9E28E|nr:NUDIX domain-containing protein [Geothrix sp. 21YS21S-2]
MIPVRVAVGAIRRGGRFFLQRRDLESARFPGLWEFPGGKAEPAETLEAALLRELREELEWTPERAEPLGAVEHDYGGFRVELHLFLCEGPMPLDAQLAWGWFAPGEMARLPMPAANLRLVSLLGSGAPQL